MIKSRMILSIAATTLLLAGTTAFAASSEGPEPYTAPDPHYKPMKQEPLVTRPASPTINLGSAEDIKGPAAGPEPYSAPDPSDAK